MSGAWFDAMVQPLGWTLLHFVWQGALVGVFYALLLLVLRDAAAGTRYAAAVATLAVLALLPAGTFIALTSSPAELAPELTRLQTAPWMVSGAAESAGLQGQGWLLWIVAFWISGVAVMTGRLWLSWRYIVHLRRSADAAATARLKPMVGRLGRAMGIARQVQIALSQKVQAPVVIGWIKPLILLPPAVINRLPSEQIEMVLAHELAHIRRHDHLVNWFQTIIETLLFYHPVVAWVSRHIRIERENACDDLVIRSTDDRLAYVEMLASLERMRPRGPQLALGVNDGQILGRIRRLVERSRPRRQRGVVIPAMLVSATLLAGIGLGFLPDEQPASEPGRDRLMTATAPEPAVSQVPAGEDRPAPPTGQPRPVERETRANPSVASTASSAPPLEPDPFERSDDEARPASTIQTVSPGPSTPDTADAVNASARQTVDAPRSAPPEATETVASAGASLSRDPASPEPSIEPAGPSSASERPLQLAALPRNQQPAPLADEPRLVALEPAPITGGALIQRIEPEYPSRAHRRLTSGVVELEFVVDREGRVDDIEILREHPPRWRFGKVAEEAVAQWRFEPFRRADQAIERTVRVEVAFEPDPSTCLAVTGTRIPNC